MAWIALSTPALALEIEAGAIVQVGGAPALLADVVVPTTIQTGGEWPRVEPQGQDRWGRPIIRLTSTGGRSLAAALVRAGQALVSPDAAPDELAGLLQLEAQAREAQLGLWAQRRWRIQDAADVRGRIGDLVLVQGRVQAVGWAGDRLYMNFGADRREDFTAAAERWAVRDVAASGLRLEELAGRNLRLRGWLMQVGGPMIEITGPAQIEVLP
jgi:hypothetical protein